jgi:2-C-methyl-D-erythritol 4-phosphate cytidylyltransferase
MQCGAVLVAAGRSARMGFDKLLATLDGRPVLAHSLDLLASMQAISQIVVVTTPEKLERVRELVDSRLNILVRPGGNSRQESVERGVAALSPEVNLVLIHDAARPLATAAIMDEGLRRGAETGAAIAAIPVSDTIKLVASDGSVERTPERARLFAAQTPQVFRRDWLEASYARLHACNEPPLMTDEASLLEWAGYRVHIFPGDARNIKLTNPIDLTLAEALLRAAP